MKLMLAVVLLFSINVFAKITVEKIDYKDSETLLEGAIVFDKTKVKKNKKLPAVIVVHDWLGVGDYVMMRAKQLAELGYVAFVADIYGKGVRPKDTKEAGETASKLKAGDRKAMRSRVLAAHDFLKTKPYVNSDKISAMGYCFGGTVALEAARMGLPLAGVISFHGGLSAVSPDDANKINTKLLILHGAIDPFVPAAEVATFQKELNDAGKNYEFVSYSGAVHAFTLKGAGNDIKQGAAYNEQADRRSFVAMKDFLAEVNQ